jgi:hypothetical protein
MNTTGEGSMLTKQDLRKSAFREISAKTVAPGPYWNGFESALNRPQTGAVLSAEAITKSSIYYKPDQPSNSVVNKGKGDSRTEEKGLFQASSRIGSASSTSRSAQFNMPTARSNNNSDNINNNNNNNNSARSNSFKNYLATTRSSSARICSSRRETYRESARENMFKSSSSSARSRFQTTGDMMIAGLNTEPVPVVASGRTSRRVGATEANLWN